MADKVGDEFDGYVTGVTRLRPLHRADRALRRGHGPRLDDGRRLLPVRRAARTCCSGENTGKVYRLGDRVHVQVDQGRHGAAAGRSGARRDSRRRYASRSRIAVRGGARRSRARERGERRKGSKRKAEAGKTGARQGKRRERRRTGGLPLVASFLRGDSLKFLMPLPMPRPISGSRLAPKEHHENKDDDEFGNPETHVGSFALGEYQS